MIFIMTFLIIGTIVGYIDHNVGMVQFNLGAMCAYSCLMALDKFILLLILRKEAKCASKEK
jgi:hypothetical protein